MFLADSRCRLDTFTFCVISVVGIFCANSPCRSLSHQTQTAHIYAKSLFKTISKKAVFGAWNGGGHGAVRVALHFTGLTCGPRLYLLFSGFQASDNTSKAKARGGETGETCFWLIQCRLDTFTFCRLSVVSICVPIVHVVFPTKPKSDTFMHCTLLT